MARHERTDGFGMQKHSREHRMWSWAEVGCLDAQRHGRKGTIRRSLHTQFWDEAHPNASLGGGWSLHCSHNGLEKSFLGEMRRSLRPAIAHALWPIPRSASITYSAVDHSRHSPFPEPPLHLPSRRDTPRPARPRRSRDAESDADRSRSTTQHTAAEARHTCSVSHSLSSSGHNFPLLLLLLALVHRRQGSFHHQWPHPSKHTYHPPSTTPHAPTSSWPSRNGALRIRRIGSCSSRPGSLRGCFVAGLRKGWGKGDGWRWGLGMGISGGGGLSEWRIDDERRAKRGARIPSSEARVPAPQARIFRAKRESQRRRPGQPERALGRARIPGSSSVSESIRRRRRELFVAVVGWPSISFASSVSAYTVAAREDSSRSSQDGRESLSRRAKRGIRSRETRRSVGSSAGTILTW